MPPFNTSNPAYVCIVSILRTQNHDSNRPPLHTHQHNQDTHISSPQNPSPTYHITTLPHRPPSRGRIATFNPPKSPTTISSQLTARLNLLQIRIRTRSIISYTHTHTKYLTPSISHQINKQPTQAPKQPTTYLARYVHTYHTNPNITNTKIMQCADRPFLPRLASPPLRRIASHFRLVRTHSSYIFKCAYVRTLAQCCVVGVYV